MVAQQLLLAAQLRVLAVQLDEDRDLGAKDVRVERLRQVVDGTARIAAEDVLLLRRDRRQEDDRDRARLLPLLDERGRLEAVEAGHLDVEQDHRDVVDEQLAQRGLAGTRANQVLPERLDDRLQRDEVLLQVVDEQDVGLRFRAHLLTAAGRTQSP